MPEIHPIHETQRWNKIWFVTVLACKSMLVVFLSFYYPASSIRAILLIAGEQRGAIQGFLLLQHTGRVRSRHGYDQTASEQEI